FRVAQRNLMPFARAAAVFVAGACGEESAEHTVLGVKNRKMLIRNHLEFVGTDRAREIGDLRGVEIMCRRESLNTDIEKGSRCESIRSIQTEMTDARRRRPAGIRERAQQPA